MWCEVEIMFEQVQTHASGSMTIGLWLEDAAALEGGSASASSVVGQVRGKRKKIVKTRSAGASYA